MNQHDHDPHDEYNARKLTGIFARIDTDLANLKHGKKDQYHGIGAFFAGLFRIIWFFVRAAAIVALVLMATVPQEDQMIDATYREIVDIGVCPTVTNATRVPTFGSSVRSAMFRQTVFTDSIFFSTLADIQFDFSNETDIFNEEFYAFGVFNRTFISGRSSLEPLCNVFGN